MSEFIKVSACLMEDQHDVIELPLEEDSTLLLSTIHAQFPQATGLKYYNPDSGAWRGVRLVEGVLSASSDGWGDLMYVAVFPDSVGMNGSMGDSNKRKLESGSQESGLDRAPKNPRHGLGRTSREASPFSEYSNSPYDLIVLGIPYKAMEGDMREYFEQFGDLELCELKRNAKTHESRGFGFIRFITSGDRESVLARPEHYLLGRQIEVKVPRKSEDLPRKVFVGQLPHEPDKSELASQFEKYGNIIDVYVPKPFRGFGFVTFQTGEEAQRALSGGAELGGNILNVTCANPKPSQDRIQRWKLARERDQQDQIFLAGPSYSPAAAYPQESSQIIYRSYPFDFNFQPKLPSAIMRYTTHPQRDTSHSFTYSQPPSPGSYSSASGATYYAGKDGGKYSIMGAHQPALSPQQKYYW